MRIKKLCPKCGIFDQKELQWDNGWQVECICGKIIPLENNEVPPEAKLNRRQYELAPLQSPSDIHFVHPYINTIPQFNQTRIK